MPASETIPCEHYMDQYDWNDITNPPRAQWVKNPDKVRARLVYFMNELGAAVGNNIYISTGGHEAYNTSGHSSTSSHYVGRAVDFHVANLHPREVLEIIESMLASKGFTNSSGVGYYPSWNNIGFHIDLCRNGKLRWTQYVKGGGYTYGEIAVGKSYVNN